MAAPINLGVEALQAAIWWVVTAWEDVARDHDRLSSPSPLRRRGAGVVRAVSVLGPRVGLLADLLPVELPDYPLVDDCDATRFRGVTLTMRPGWRGVLDFVALHRRARVMLGLTSPARRLPGVCGCGREELRQDQPRFRGDDPLVVCGNCAASMSYDEWKAMMSAWV